MPELIDPTPELRTSFLAAVAEFRADRDHPTPWFVDDVDPSALTDAAAFAAYVTRVLSERDEAARRADGFVPMRHRGQRRLVHRHGRREAPLLGADIGRG